MTDWIALDSSPLFLRVKEVREWLAARLAKGSEVFLPEITDYEVRRELLRLGKQQSIQRLDALQRTLTYLPLDTAAMRRAAEMWAVARTQGTPTADPREIDADVILAAQAEAVSAVVATENVGHLARFVIARHWRDIE